MLKRIYALPEFSVEYSDGKWFYWRNQPYESKKERHGPYSSEMSVSLMIARELKRAIIVRDAPYVR